MPTPSRRNFLKTAATSVAALPAVANYTTAAPTAAKLPVAGNQYSWITFYGRDKKQWGKDLDADLAEFKKCGIPAYEPAVNGPEDVAKLVPLLKKHGLAMPSLYVGSTMHRADEAERSIQTAVAIAEAARPAGLKIMVTNPSPLKWGGTESKTDAELQTQAQALDKLGAALRERGVTLAYHTHDVEMRHAAREFHHMLLGTNPKNVALCLDCHWVYRGSGNSQVALFDIVKLYGPRIVELHLRQSVNGVWGEVFGPGDIDYPRLAAELKRQNIRPHYVLEQCLEKDSPNTTDVVTAHQKDLVYLREVFGA